MKQLKHVEKASPLKEKPLRLPGQSTDERLDQKWEAFEPYCLAFVFAGALALLEWWRYFMKQPPMPTLYSLLFLTAALIFIRKSRIFLAQAKRIKQGRDGERIVAEQLEKLRAHGYRIFHDLVAGNFNVDHVLVGPSGVFAVETKTPSKGKGRNQIQFDGEKITVNGITLPRNPIIQSKSNAKWLHDMLAGITGKPYWVKPVVVFPSWDVRRKTKDDEVLVLNHKEIEAAITHQRNNFSEKEVMFIASALEKFARN
jgi:Nuclease-related domain